VLLQVVIVDPSTCEAVLLSYVQPQAEVDLTFEPAATS